MALQFLKNRPILIQLLFWFLIIEFPAEVVLTYISYRNAEEELTRQITNGLHAIGTRQAAQINNYLKDREEMAKTMAMIPEVVSSVERYTQAFRQESSPLSTAYQQVDTVLHKTLTYYMSSFKYDDMLLVSTSGEVVFTANKREELGVNLNKNDKYRSSELARVYERAVTLLETNVSDFAYHPDGTQPSAFIAAPVFRNKKPIGILVLEIDNQEISQVVNDYTGLGTTGESKLVTRIGPDVVFITGVRSNPDAAFKVKVPVSGNESLAVVQAVQGKGGSGMSIDHRGTPVLATWSYVPSMRAGIVVKIDQEEAFAPIVRLRRILMIIIGITLLVVVLAAVSVARSFSKPITRLTDITHRLAAGDLNQRVVTTGKDEIAQLGQSFNRMAAQLLEDKVQLEDYSKNLERKVEERTAELLAQRQKVQEQLEEMTVMTEELRQQSEEISTQRDFIKQQKESLEVAFEDMKTLGVIGQELTASLSFETSFMRLYEYVRHLMPADGFGVYVADQKKWEVERRYFLHEGGKLPSEVMQMDRFDKFPVVCIMQRKEIMLHDHDTERHLFVRTNRPFRQEGPAEGRRTLSRIYLPLYHSEKVIGALTVQSFAIGAYTSYHLSVMRTLAAYTAIALANANAYAEIEGQKQIIERKNEDITASINYASRIQNALLPGRERLRACFPDSFVLFKPRDIVSGDFYWLADLGDKAVLVASDCTGHGVPGAFMSMLGVELLDQTVYIKGITRPDLILREMHVGIRTLLRQETTDNRDGMDMAIVTIHRKTQNIQFAGAMNGLLLIQDHHMAEIKADRHPIGGLDRNKAERVFSLHELPYKPGLSFYIFSDGYRDQFGGPQGRKITSKGFKDFITTFCQLPMPKQGEALEKVFADWQKDQKQLDDVLVIGVRL